MLNEIEFNRIQKDFLNRGAHTHEKLWLFQKIIEECCELSAAMVKNINIYDHRPDGRREAVVEELADVINTINLLFHSHPLLAKEVRRMREKKMLKRLTGSDNYGRPF